MHHNNTDPNNVHFQYNNTNNNNNCICFGLDPNTYEMTPTSKNSDDANPEPTNKSTKFSLHY